MKCDFCEKEFPAEEIETVSGALRDSGDPQEFHVCETCAASIREAGRKRPRYANTGAAARVLIDATAASLNCKKA